MSGFTSGNAETTGTTQAPFNDNAALIRNVTDNTKLVIFSAASVSTGTTRTVTMPDANGTATLLGNTSTGSGSIVLATSPALVLPTISDSGDTTKKIAFTASGNTTGVTLTLAAQNATSQTINLPVTRQTETFAIRPQTTQSSPSDPTATASTTGVMMGLAGSITPQVTGKILLMVSGTLSNDTILDGVSIQLRTGTGTAPTNGTALTGTTAGGLLQFNTAVAGEKAPVCAQAIVSGLTLGTAVWLDVGLAAITGGNASLKNVSVTAFEL